MAVRKLSCKPACDQEEKGFLDLSELPQKIFPAIPHANWKNTANNLDIMYTTRRESIKRQWVRRIHDSPTESVFTTFKVQKRRPMLWTKNEKKVQQQASENNEVKVLPEVYNLSTQLYILLYIIYRNNRVYHTIHLINMNFYDQSYFINKLIYQINHIILLFFLIYHFYSTLLTIYKFYFI